MPVSIKVSVLLVVSVLTAGCWDPHPPCDDGGNGHRPDMLRVDMSAGDDAKCCRCYDVTPDWCTSY